MYFTKNNPVLRWLRSKVQQEKYIENHLKVICATKDLTCKYISTDKNPANIVSRGAKFDELKINKPWWHGPEWLVKKKEYWPEQKLPIFTAKLQVVNFLIQFKSCINLENYSLFLRLLTFFICYE